MTTTTKKDFYLTKEGIDKLKAEVDDLANKQRAEVASELKAAKEFGDLSENAEYDEETGFNRMAAGVGASGMH